MLSVDDFGLSVELAGVGLELFDDEHVLTLLLLLLIGGLTGTVKNSSSVVAILFLNKKNTFFEFLFRFIILD